MSTPLARIRIRPEQVILSDEIDQITHPLTTRGVVAHQTQSVIHKPHALALALCALAALAIVTAVMVLR